MTARESVHRIVDTLPEDRLADVLDYLADLQDSHEPLSGETQAAIAEGLDDIRAGRTVTVAEYRRAPGCETYRRPASTLLFESVNSKLGDGSELFTDLEE